MSSDTRSSVFSVLALMWIATATPASTMKSQLPKHSATLPATLPADSEAQAELSRVIAGILSDTGPAAAPAQGAAGQQHHLASTRA